MTRNAGRLWLSVLALGLFAGAALAQSAPSTSPPAQRQTRPSGGDSGDGSVNVDVGSVIDAVKWAARKKREAEAKRKAEAEKAAAAERERIAEAERDRARAEREADAARMRPIPDPEPAPQPLPPPRRTGDDSHRRPTLDQLPRAPRSTRTPEPAPERPVATRPAQPVTEPPAAPLAPTPTPTPAPSVPAAPAVQSPPPADLLVVSDEPPWRTIALWLAVLLAVAVTAVFAIRQAMGAGAAPVSVRPGVDHGDADPPDFGGRDLPQFAIHVERGEETATLDYPEPAESDPR